MILMPRHNALFISCGRTGTNTMYAVLREHYEGRHHQPCGDYHCRTVPPECHDWFKFHTVRNPYSRAVSIWRTITTGGVAGKYAKVRETVSDMESFGAFAHEALMLGLIPTTRILEAAHVWHGRTKFDAFLKLEDLDNEAAAKLPFWAGPDHIPQAANSLHQIGPPWQELYDEPTRQAVEKWAGPEFERYGYEREMGI